MNKRHISISVLLNLLSSLVELNPVFRFYELACVIHCVYHINLFVFDLVHLLHELLPSIKVLDSLVGSLLLFPKFHDPSV